MLSEKEVLGTKEIWEGGSRVRNFQLLANKHMEMGERMLKRKKGNAERGAGGLQR